MPFYQVIVQVEYLATYRLEAETQEEAERTGREMAADGMNYGSWEFQLADVYDVSDESAER
jgi:hypothetical protein